MARVIWTRGALAQLELIDNYLNQFDPHAAQDLVGHLKAAGDSLALFPDRGRPAGGGARELPTVPPYVIRYETLGDAVFIVRIKHGRQYR